MDDAKNRETFLFPDFLKNLLLWTQSEIGNLFQKTSLLG